MSAAAQAVLLAQKYDDSINPEGWWMSEKLDGVRAYWTGSQFFSRNGNPFIAPKFFTKDLPKTPLDGELWCGRGMFSKALSVVKKTKNPEKFADDWKYLTYLCFDAPSHGGTYEERVKHLKKVINPAKQTTYAAVVGISKCKNRAHLKETLKEVLKKGGEGVMLRKPGSKYEHKRSHTLLKVKYFHDEEAKVTGRLPGSGRCSDMMGKVECVLPNGCKFKVGSGFSDAQRKNKKFCKIGSIITFKYQELSSHGNPRFPVFLRERPDLTWEDVVKNAKTKPPFSQLKQRAPKLQKQHSIMFSTVPSRDQATGKKIVVDQDIDDKAGDAVDVDDDHHDADGDDSSSSSGAAAAAAAGGDDDDDDDAPKKKAGKKGGKRACKYGANCFRTNPTHLADFDHPARASLDDDDSGAAAAGAAGDDDKDSVVSRADSKSKVAKKTTGTLSGGGDDDDDDVELPADLESDAKKSKAELDAEIDEVSGGVGPKTGSDASTVVRGKRKGSAIALPEITNGKDSNVFKRKKPAVAAAAAASAGSDGDDDEKSKTAKAGGKIACFYGAKCYQRNEAHLKRFSHPSADEKSTAADDDTEVEELREKAQAAKLEARLVRSESTTSVEAKEIDAKLAEYYDLGLASDDDESHPTPASSAAHVAPTPDRDSKDSKHRSSSAGSGAAAASSSSSAAAAGGGSWGIASDGEEEEQVTLTMSKKEFEKFQKLTAAVNDVAHSVKATAVGKKSDSKAKK